MVMPETGCEVVPIRPTMRADTTTKKKVNSSASRTSGRCIRNAGTSHIASAERRGAADHASATRDRVSVRGGAAARSPRGATPTDATRHITGAARPIDHRPPQATAPAPTKRT